MNPEERSKVHILSIVTNNAVGDSRVLKSAETLATAGYKVTLLAGLIGHVPPTESIKGFTILRAPSVSKYGQNRHRPLFPFNYILDLSNQYLPRGKRFVRYGCKMFTPDRLLWRWATPILIKISPKFLYLCWPILKDGEKTFGKVIDELKPDIIHANDCDTLGLAMRAKRRAFIKGRSIRVLYDAHEYVSGVHRKHPNWRLAMTMLERSSIKRVDAVMTVSETIAGMLADDYQLKERPAVVLNAPRRQQPMIDESLQTIRKKIGLAPNIPLHLYVGAAAPQRGLDTMVEALVAAHGHHIALVVNTNAPYINGLLKKAVDLGIRDRVHVHPYVPEWYVSTFASDATSGVIPILHHPNHEISLVTKYFEYLHARIPIIVSDVKTMSEEILLQGNGLVFPAGKAYELADRFERITVDRAQYLAAITESMLDEYSWELQGDKLVEVHDGLAQLATLKRKTR
ncbi:MAG: glycosyltransferase family 4 protein [Actinobacteria bacterium]|nr:glycosyltransferase family 4 protein [Actinomycetota bacterium]